MICGALAGMIHADVDKLPNITRSNTAPLTNLGSSATARRSRTVTLAGPSRPWVKIRTSPSLGSLSIHRMARTPSEVLWMWLLATGR